MRRSDRVGRQMVIGVVAATNEVGCGRAVPAEPPAALHFALVPPVDADQAPEDRQLADVRSDTGPPQIPSARRVIEAEDVQEQVQEFTSSPIDLATVINSARFRVP